MKKGVFSLCGFSGLILRALKCYKGINIPTKEKRAKNALLASNLTVPFFTPELYGYSVHPCMNKRITILLLDDFSSKIHHIVSFWFLHLHWDPIRIF